MLSEIREDFNKEYVVDDVRYVAIYPSLTCHCVKGKWECYESYQLALDSMSDVIKTAKKMSIEDFQKQLIKEYNSPINTFLRRCRTLFAKVWKKSSQEKPDCAECNRSELQKVRELYAEKAHQVIQKKIEHHQELQSLLV